MEDPYCYFWNTFQAPQYQYRVARSAQKEERRAAQNEERRVAQNENRRQGQGEATDEPV